MPRPKSASDASKPKRVTLQDIARVADLHVMTVSDALSGKRIVKAETRERVKRIAKELNYIPNSAAKALATGKTGLIAVMTGPLDELYFATMVRLLGLKMNADGYRIILTPTEVNDLMDAAGNTAIDGAIAIDRYDLIEQFQTYSPVPCVSIGTHEWSFVDNVNVDLGPAVTTALEKMWDAGRRRIAYVVTTPHMGEPSEVRAAAYWNFMERMGAKPELIVMNCNSLPLFSTKLQAYFEEQGCPEGLFCQNDDTAMGAFDAVTEMGLRMPEDVMLVGCDGLLQTSYFKPKISSIAQPMEAMSAIAWQFLKNRMAQPDIPIQHVVMLGKLLERDTLGKSEKSES